MSDRDVIARLSPEEIVGLTLYGEARGSSPALRTAIACVIQNRAAAQRSTWGLTPQAVCLAPIQFSCWSSASGAANYSSVMDAAAHLADKRQPQGPTIRECLALAWHVTGGTLDDTVKGATLYYSPPAMVPPGRIPFWAVGRDAVVIIDSTHFFAEAA
jgi:hypothetical protein